MSPNRRRGPKITWSEDDDVRLCRAYVSSTQSEDGTEHVKNMWVRVHEIYNSIVEEEEPSAAPRAMSALQTHWATLLRPDLALFMALLVQVENEGHGSWTQEDLMLEANNRFDATKEEEKAAQMHQYEEAKQKAEATGETPPPKPRGKIKPFRYPRCIPILRESKRFMRSVLSEKKDPIAASRKRSRRSLIPNEAEETGDASDPGSDDNTEQIKQTEELVPRHNARNARTKHRVESLERRSPAAQSPPSSIESDEEVTPTAAVAVPTTTVSPLVASVVAPVVMTRVVAPSLAEQRNISRSDTMNSNHALLKEKTLNEQRELEEADYRLKLLAELRGVVETIAQLSNQLVNGAVTLMAVDAQIKSGPTLTEEVKEDLQFFREQKRRLKQELDVIETS
ncbi:hypothetical protein JM18_004526 [Phytophthora kernoviae]|uniref:Uncharacterized protein n=2 Tax=Phytophthora kernoviae TaxID=325452 RepID=A0A922AN06_9STRA|nr:hypothetical protein G195_005756 [Phytophthora kernoviae 00238/432]KAG2526186.1 hypothetical protein JM18_004526 [Phytophthora kernoviae]